MLSTEGFDILPRNCRAKEETPWAYRRCPSANRVSKARDDLPEPLIPVITTSLFRGISSDIPFKLFTSALRMEMFPFIPAKIRNVGGMLYGIEPVSGTKPASHPILYGRRRFPRTRFPAHRFPEAFGGFSGRDQALPKL